MHPVLLFLFIFPFKRKSNFLFFLGTQLKANQFESDPAQGELKAWCESLDSWVLDFVSTNAGDLFDKPKGSGTITRDMLRQTMNDTFRIKHVDATAEKPAQTYASVTIKFRPKKETNEILIKDGCYLREGGQLIKCDPLTALKAGSSIQVNAELASIYSQKSTKAFGVKFVCTRLIIDNSAIGGGGVDPAAIEAMNNDPLLGGAKFATDFSAGDKRPAPSYDEDCEDYPVDDESKHQRTE
jgi:hypothetical protein